MIWYDRISFERRSFVGFFVCLFAALLLRFFVCVNLYTITSITRLSFSNHSLIFIGFWNRKIEKHNMRYQIRYSWEDDEISSFCIYMYIFLFPYQLSLIFWSDWLFLDSFFFFVCVLTTHILDDPDGWLVCPKYCRSIYNQIRPYINLQIQFF